MSRPKRLAGVSYIGLARYSLTFCVKSRRTAFADHSIARTTVDQILRTAIETHFETTAYCVMPDYAHLLVEGLSLRSDLRKFAKAAKQRTGAAYAMKGGGPLWQEGYYERVLREDDDVKGIARYIIENPIRAKLVAHPSEYPFCGSQRWTVEELLEYVS